MANGIRTGDPCGFNKGCGSKFREGSQVQQTPEEGWRTYQPTHCGNNNKDEDNSPKTLNDKSQTLFVCTQLYGFKYSFLILIILTNNGWYNIKPNPTNNSICTRLNMSTYCYLSLVILFIKYTYLIQHCFQILLSNTNSSICAQLSGFKCYYVILIIQFNISYLFAHI